MSSVACNFGEPRGIAIPRAVDGADENLKIGWLENGGDANKPSNWADAQRALIDSLRCKFCGAANRPGAHYIEFVDGTAFCTVCGKSFSTGV